MIANAQLEASGMFGSIMSELTNIHRRIDDLAISIRSTRDSIPDVAQEVAVRAIPSERVRGAVTSVLDERELADVRRIRGSTGEIVRLMLGGFGSVALWEFAKWLLSLHH